ncbi:hypothetical protein M7I_4503 [Glarea lozoyensis 74030]|uniref:Uncharacterized protein n=1 Tax=Glarea lozoyensis (strain ATCC 74030 / MF5533) TaxID=1104152 RepID=H0EPC9_GLAL7|nr:hypothetical protein M7I_4503 [Glarea lozoyensis 74030]
MGFRRVMSVMRLLRRRVRIFIVRRMLCRRLISLLYFDIQNSQLDSWWKLRIFEPTFKRRRGAKR